MLKADPEILTFARARLKSCSCSGMCPRLVRCLSRCRSGRGTQKRCTALCSWAIAPSMRRAQHSRQHPPRSRPRGFRASDWGSCLLIRGTSGLRASSLSAPRSWSPRGRSTAATSVRTTSRTTTTTPPTQSTGAPSSSILMIQRHTYTAASCAWQTTTWLGRSKTLTPCASFQTNAMCTGPRFCLMRIAPSRQPRSEEFTTN